jgi:hypothetical protein
MKVEDYGLYRLLKLRKCPMPNNSFNPTGINCLSSRTYVMSAVSPGGLMRA